MDFPAEGFGQRPANYYEQYQYANYYDRDGGGGGDVTYNYNGPHQRGRGRGRGHHNQRGGWKPHGQQQTNYGRNDDPNGHKPWMTPEILEGIKERNDLMRKAQESGSPDDWSIFKAVRNRTALLLNDAKRLYEAKQAEVTTTKSGKRTFYCDTCDRSFGNQELLNEHNAEHVTCKLDGCSFTAHPKVILKHIEMQHSNNLFSRVRGYDTPEDIEKWKEERRSKFPTVHNIQRQQEEREERQQRGERLPLTDNEKFKRWQERKKQQQEGGHVSNGQRGKPFNSRGRGGMAGRGRQFNANRFDNGPRPPRQPANNDTEPRTETSTTFQRSRPPIRPRQSDTSIIVLESFYVNVKVGEGGALVGKKMVPWDGEMQRLSQKIARTGLPLVSAEQQEESEESEGEMEAEKVDDITDEEEDQIPSVVHPKVPEIQAVSPASEPKVPTASLGLVAYSCDSDSDAEPPTELPIDSRKEEGELEEEEEDVKPVGGPTDIPPEMTSETPASVTKEPEDRPPKRNYDSRDSKKDQARGHSQEFKRRKRSRMPKLLQKLLQGDIRHERNQILQVCRFIVQNNFFDDNAGVTEGSGGGASE